MEEVVTLLLGGFRHVSKRLRIWRCRSRRQVSDRRQKFPQVLIRSDPPCALAWRCCPVTATAGSSWRQRRGGLALRPAAERWSSRSAPARTAARRGTAAGLGRRQEGDRGYLVILLLGYSVQRPRVKKYKRLLKLNYDVLQPVLWFFF